MIFAQAAQSFTARLYGAETGIVPTVSIEELDGTVLYGPSAVGVTESATTPGVYSVLLTAPATPLDGSLLRVVWRDGSFGATAEDLRVTDEPADGAGGVYPNMSEVGAQIAQRTLDAVGNTDGTFNADTIPTGRQVERLMLSAWQEVSARVGLSPPAAVVPLVRNVVALRTAMMVERTYFAHQITTDRSAYNALRDEYALLLQAVIDQTVDVGGGGEVGEGDTDGLGPRYRVPDFEMTSWDTPL